MRQYKLTKEGIKQVIQDELTRAAVHMHETYGLPVESFNDFLDRNPMTLAEQWDWLKQLGLPNIPHIAHNHA